MRKFSLFLKKCCAILIIALFSIQSVCGYSYAQAVPMAHSTSVLSSSFTPTLLKGVTINSNNPLLFDFIVDQGQTQLSDQDLEQEVTKLVKYFLASIATPEDDLWVNLSPYEQNRIIPQTFSQTDMGRDLLAQDYILKRLTSSLLHPETETGKQFFAKVYEQAFKQFGTTDIPVDSFHKVWIVPNEFAVVQHGNTAMVSKNTLKVMLEKDFRQQTLDDRQKKSFSKDNLSSVYSLESSISTEIMRQVIIPAIEHEVNYGKSFAPLRQITQALVLANWYRQALKDSLVNRLYEDQNKITGIDTNDPQMKNRLYQKYLKTFEDGIYNFIKEEKDPYTHEEIARHYFSGGTALHKDVDFALASALPSKQLLDLATAAGKVTNHPYQLKPADVDLAILTNGQSSHTNGWLTIDGTQEQYDRVARFLLDRYEAGHTNWITPTGNTAVRLYETILNEAQDRQVNFSDLKTWNLDADIGSKEYYDFMMDNFWGPAQKLGFKLENAHIPDGTAVDLKKEVEEYEKSIPKDAIAILGIGGEGHVGFNEAIVDWRSLSGTQKNSIESNSDLFNHNEFILPEDILTNESNLKSFLKFVFSGRLKQRAENDFKDVLEKINEKRESLADNSGAYGDPFNIEDLKGLQDKFLNQAMTLYVPGSEKQTEWGHRVVAEVLKEQEVPFKVEVENSENIKKSKTRIVELALDTIINNSPYAKTADDLLTQAITMGIGTINKAFIKLILAFGESKANAIENTMGKEDPGVPSTLVMSNAAHVVTDQEAASKVELGELLNQDRPNFLDAKAQPYLSNEKVLTLTPDEFMSLAKGEIDEIESAFTKQIVDGIESRKATGESSTSLKVINSGLFVSGDLEPGEYLVIDWGGTNIRVIKYVVDDKGNTHEEAIASHEFSPEEQKKDKSYVHEVINRLMDELKLDPEIEYPVSLIFSFAYEQKSLNEAYLTHELMDKGWQLEGLDSNVELVNFLQSGLAHNAKIEMIMNDTTAVLLSNPNAVIGLILGTGVNIAVVNPETGEIIVLESGGFDDETLNALTQSGVDLLMLQDLHPFGYQRTEKMSSGAYLGEDFRRQIVELIKDGKLISSILEKSFSNEGGVSSELVSYIQSVASHYDIENILFEYGFFDDDNVSSLSRHEEVEALKGNVTNVINNTQNESRHSGAKYFKERYKEKLIKKIKLAQTREEVMALVKQNKYLVDKRDDVGERQLNRLQEVAKVVALRSGVLTATQVVGSAKFFNPELDKPVIVSVDGSVIEHHAVLKQGIQDAINHLAKDKSNNIQVTKTGKNATGKGAANGLARLKGQQRQAAKLDSVMKIQDWTAQLRSLTKEGNVLMPSGELATEVAKDFRHISFPENGDIVVVYSDFKELREYNTGMLELLRQNNNRIHYIQVDTWATLDLTNRLNMLGVDPDLVLIPNGFFEPLPAAKQAVDKLAKARQKRTPYLAYEVANRHDDPVTHYVPISRSDMQGRNIPAMGNHRSQLDRTQYGHVILATTASVAAQARAKGIDLGDAPHANAFVVKNLISKGKLQDSPAILRFDGKMFIIIFSPHSDDDAIPNGGPIIMALDHKEKVKEEKTGVMIYQRGSGIYGVSRDLLTPDQQESALYRMQEEINANFPIWQNIVSTAEHVPLLIKRLEERWSGERTADQKDTLRMLQTFTHPEDFREAILNWKEGDSISDELNDFVVRIVRLSEQEGSSQAFRGHASFTEREQGLQERLMRVNWMDTITGLWPPSAGRAPQELMDIDKQVFYDTLEEDIQSNLGDIREDNKNGIPLMVIPPHELDKHPHHQDVTELAEYPLVELSEKYGIDILPLSYISTWSGNENLFVTMPGPNGETTFPDDVVPFGASASGFSIGELVSELARVDGFGAESYDPGEHLTGPYVGRYFYSVAESQDNAMKVKRQGGVKLSRQVDIQKGDSSLLSESLNKIGVSLENFQGFVPIPIGFPQPVNPAMLLGLGKFPSDVGSTAKAGQNLPHLFFRKVRFI